MKKRMLAVGIITLIGSAKIVADIASPAEDTALIFRGALLNEAQQTGQQLLPVNQAGYEHKRCRLTGSKIKCLKELIRDLKRSRYMAQKSLADSPVIRHRHHSTAS